MLREGPRKIEGKKGGRKNSKIQTTPKNQKDCTQPDDFISRKSSVLDGRLAKVKKKTKIGSSLRRGLFKTKKKTKNLDKLSSVELSLCRGLKYW